MPRDAALQLRLDAGCHDQNFTAGTRRSCQTRTPLLRFVVHAIQLDPLYFWRGVSKVNLVACH
jgi:hypothetical protein